MAQHANQAYCGKNNSIGLDIGKEVVADVIEHEYDSFGKKLNAITIYFKGETLSKEEWTQRQVRNSFLKFSQHGIRTKIDSIWVEHVEKMMPRLFLRIQTILGEVNERKKYYRFFFTGHAVGGAYALLAALFFKRWNLNYIISTGMIWVITFGAPRIGNPEFARLASEYFNNWGLIRMLRVTHTNDWLPREFLPASSYRHVTKEIWISEPDCDCEKLSFNYGTIDGRHRLYDCDTVNKREVIESLECNFGTTDSSHTLKPDIYFGVRFGDCERQDYRYSRIKLKGYKGE
ncbi:hypothetical protein G9A89_006003 [Geosiphon pyriformis]|nr:hypothetical protein G9A89_006003 [Geosiphon pyriformis]